jgi:hypothetical protein
VKIRELIVDETMKEVTAKQTADLTDSYERPSPSLVVGSTKTDATRRIAVPSFLADELAAFIEPDTLFIFTDNEGGPIGHTNFYKRVFVPSVRGTFPEWTRQSERSANHKDPTRKFRQEVWVVDHLRAKAPGFTGHSSRRRERPPCSGRLSPRMESGSRPDGYAALCSSISTAAGSA